MLELTPNSSNEEKQLTSYSKLDELSIFSCNNCDYQSQQKWAVKRHCQSQHSAHEDKKINRSNPAFGIVKSQLEEMEEEILSSEEYDNENNLESYDGFYGVDNVAKMSNGITDNINKTRNEQFPVVELTSQIEKRLTSKDVELKGSIFACKACGYESKSKFSVKRHLIIKHAPRENIECIHCHKIFRNKFGYDYHTCSRKATKSSAKNIKKEK